MTNLYLQKKSIERNKFYKILISLMIILFFGFLLYSFISCIKDIDIPSLYMLGNTLYALPYLIIFFIFFTFECCYKLNRYYEPICVTKKGMKSVYKNQLLSIFLYDLLLFSGALLFNVVYIFVNKQFSVSLVIHTLIVLVIYFLLCILSAIFIGFLLSKIKKKFVSYIIMLIIAISETNLMDSLSVGVYNSTGTDITKSLKFFNIAPASIGWTPNMHSGYIITLDKLSQILFFIFLALLFFCLTDNEISKNSKILKSTICFCLCVITLVGYILPFSAAQMNLSASGVSADKRYYENNEQVSEPADFKVESYDLEFNFRNDLNAVATIKTDDFKNEYKFTLYHGYKISKITDSNNNDLDFTRDSDYLTINNTSKSKLIKIYYHGSCDKYYSNYLSVFLPGNFAFYPIPGFNKMYSTHSYSGFDNLSLPYQTDFNVTVHSLKKVQCNLESSTNNEFKGKSDSLTLLSGFIDCVTINETQIYYPYFNEAYNSDTINKKLETFVSKNQNIKKIFIIPDINLEDIEFVKTFNDYMITASIDDIDRLGFVSKISANKMELYDAVNAYMNYPEYFEFLKENSSEELKKAIPILEEVLKNDNDGEKLEKINDYLIDNADNRNFSEFLYELR